MGMTPLHILCSNCYATPSIIKELLTKNVNVAFMRNAVGMTPLQLYLHEKKILTFPTFMHVKQQQQHVLLDVENPHRLTKTDPEDKVHFLIHVILSMGKHKTGMNVLQHSSFRDCLREAKLIGNETDHDSLVKYSDGLFEYYKNHQYRFSYTPKCVIDDCAVRQNTEAIFNDVIIHNSVSFDTVPLNPMNDEDYLFRLCNGLDYKVLDLVLTFMGKVVSNELNQNDKNTKLFPFMNAAKSPSCGLKFLYDVAMASVQNLTPLENCGQCDICNNPVLSIQNKRKRLF